MQEFQELSAQHGVAPVHWEELGGALVAISHGEPGRPPWGGDSSRQALTQVPSMQQHQWLACILGGKCGQNDLPTCRICHLRLLICTRSVEATLPVRLCPRLARRHMTPVCRGPLLLLLAGHVIAASNVETSMMQLVQSYTIRAEVRAQLMQLAQVLVQWGRKQRSRVWEHLAPRWRCVTRMAASRRCCWYWQQLAAAVGRVWAGMGFEWARVHWVHSLPFISMPG